MLPLCPEPPPNATNQVDGSQDSRIFTYINADEFTERTETDRTVSTSDKEHLNPLAMALYSRPRGSNQVGRAGTARWGAARGCSMAWAECGAELPRWCRC